MPWLLKFAKSFFISTYYLLVSLCFRQCFLKDNRQWIFYLLTGDHSRAHKSYILQPSYPKAMPVWLTRCRPPSRTLRDCHILPMIRWDIVAKFVLPKDHCHHHLCNFIVLDVFFDDDFLADYASCIFLLLYLCMMTSKQQHRLCRQRLKRFPYTWNVLDKMAWAELTLSNYLLASTAGVQAV